MTTGANRSTPDAVTPSSRLRRRVRVAAICPFVTSSFTLAFPHAMSRRTRAREIALQALFQEDLNPTNSLENLATFLAARLQDEQLREFAKQLVLGVKRNQAELDAAARRKGRPTGRSPAWPPPTATCSGWAPTKSASSTRPTASPSTKPSSWPNATARPTRRSSSTATATAGVVFADMSDGLISPSDIQFSPDGGTIYVSSLGGSGVARLRPDGTSRAPRSHSPRPRAAPSSSSRGSRC